MAAIQSHPGHHGHDCQEEHPHEAIALEDRQPGARQRTKNVAQAHRQGVAVEDSVRRGEAGHRRQVGGEVDDLCAGGGGQEIEAKQPDESKDQKAPRAGAEEAVVETDAGPNQHSIQPLPRRFEPRGVDAAEVPPPSRVEGRRNHQDQYQRPEHLAAQE